MNDEHRPGVALIVGAGDGTGAAITRTFARAGLVACPARRHGAARIYFHIDAYFYK